MRINLPIAFFCILFFFGCGTTTTDTEEKLNPWPESDQAWLVDACRKENIKNGPRHRNVNELCGCILSKLMGTYNHEDLNKHVNHLDYFYEEAKYDCITEINLAHNYKSFRYEYALTHFKNSLEFVETAIEYCSNDPDSAQFVFWKPMFEQALISAEKVNCEFYDINSSELENKYKQSFIRGLKLIVADSSRITLNKDGMKLLIEWDIWWVDKGYIKKK